VIEQGNELMTASLTKVFHLSIEPTVGGDENRGFFTTRKVTKQGLVIPELARWKKKQYGCYHSPTTVDDADLAEHTVVVPSAWSELHNLSERTSDFIPAWLVDLGLTCGYRNGRIPRIIAQGYEIVRAIGHERETLLSACWANDRISDAAGGAEKCRALIPVFPQEQIPITKCRSTSPQ
jgi:hypothetical protein